MEIFFTAAFIAAWSLIWTRKLTAYGGPFAKLPGLVDRKGIAWQIIHRAVFDCTSCHSGHVAFWYSIIRGVGIWQTFLITVSAMAIAMLIQKDYDEH